MLQSFPLTQVFVRKKPYLPTNIFQAFVESNPTLKWCPSPGCGRAVRLPSNMLPSLNVSVEASSLGETEPMTVDCGSGHFFCW